MIRDMTRDMVMNRLKESVYMFFVFYIIINVQQNDTLCFCVALCWPALTTQHTI